jgi:hypothetical protein
MNSFSLLASLASFERTTSSGHGAIAWTDRSSTSIERDTDLVAQSRGKRAVFSSTPSM